jgi:hypothetical protein
VSGTGSSRFDMEVHEEFAQQGIDGMFVVEPA